ncbi:amphi-Trp domain-containing protein [Halovenus halobia]|uniref:amphi-Trp domain-containing protein n=1 Tax=Halovenus halobia TaxID=3396622 RepID=UPI003F56479F
MTTSFERKQVASRDEAATVRRDMADGVAGGVVRLSSEGESVDVELSDEVGVELEFEVEDGEMSVGVELEWPDTSGPEEEPVESLEEMSSEGAELAVGPGETPESLARFEVFQDTASEWRWRMVHRNGTVIATGGERYTRKHNALKGIRSVRQNAPGAEAGEEGN